ncbi:MAG: PQQ-binding-like beta-propeller repeat protein [Planctomycetes bacterium]|nr:PQQ-binding-like beta-propeller repeat protein [Planctomycetota bacterium]
MRLASVAVPFALLLCAPLTPAQETVAWWPNWRGPDGTGAAPAGDPPVEWSEEQNVRWKVPIPGVGCSSPVVWSDRVYVTTAIETDREGAAPGGEPAGDDRRRRGGRGARGPSKVYEFRVLCLDRADGSTVWDTKVNECVPHEGSHPTASMASASPIVDGERVYAFFGSRGLHCLDLKGEILWSKDLGRMRIAAGFGEGASPALFGDTLVVNWDHEGESFVAAFDRESGDELWRTPRDEQTSWSTPLVVEVGDRAQVIISATGASRGYDLTTGKEVWTLGGMTQNCIPTPIHQDGVAYLMSGFRGSALQAVRLAGAKGDLKGGDHVLWTHGAGTSYTPSALLYDGRLYFLAGNEAVLTCVDAKTGTVQYEGQRIAGLRTVYSSPVGVHGRVYITSREGVTKVIKAGAEYGELATNKLDETFDGTAAIVGDEIYLRGRESLYCIARSE